MMTLKFLNSRLDHNYTTIDIKPVVSYKRGNKTQIKLALRYKPYVPNEPIDGSKLGGVVGLTVVRCGISQ